MSEPNFPVTIDIEQVWLTTAQQFASEQADLAQREHIFLNTLAVYGLHRYLEWSEIESRLEESYSWHPLTRILTGWSDLYLPNCGRLIAIPQQQNHQFVLPEILPMGCVGGVAIAVHENFTQLKILGFIPEQRLYDAQKIIEVQHLEPLDILFDALFLRMEERLLITTEIKQCLQDSPEQDYDFSSLLTEEGIADIIKRLNDLYYQNNSPTVRLGQPEPLIWSFATIRESSFDYELLAESSDLDPEIEYLTERLIDKITELRSDF